MNWPADAQPRQQDGAAIPLIVDVDGTLIRTDLLHEAALQFIASHPFEFWRLGMWTLGGKVRLKTSLAGRSDGGVDTVPLHDAVLTAIRHAQADGRPVYLASASDRRHVERLAERIGGIAGVFATDESRNLSGERKAACLAAAFGERGYDYIGNDRVDFPVWKAARRALVVSPSRGFSNHVSRAFPEAQIIAHRDFAFGPYLRALRPHQWAKNCLVLLPLIAGHSFSAEMIGRGLLAFVCFCFAASSAYIINDLLDLSADRMHARKRLRPFASGMVPLAHGPPLAFLLMAAAIGGALLLPGWFVDVLLAYVALTLAYSAFLKRRVLIDVITLGALYTARVLGGVVAAGSRESPWLLMFSLFLFLSLAIVKRCSELIAQRAAGNRAAVGRGYRVDDLNVLFGLGAASGYGSVLVIALYIASPEVQVLYRHPDRLWLACPLLLYWISRILILSNRDELHDDPVVFALTDRVSWLVGLCAGLVVAAAI